MKDKLTPKKILEMFNHLSDAKKSGMNETAVNAEFYEFQKKVIFPLTVGSKRNDIESIERVATPMNLDTQAEFKQYVAMSYQNKREGIKQKAA